MIVGSYQEPIRIIRKIEVVPKSWVISLRSEAISHQNSTCSQRVSIIKTTKN